MINAVDADWKGFGVGGPLDLFDMRAPDKLSAAWRGRFEGDGSDALRAFDEVPVYRKELGVSRVP